MSRSRRPLHLLLLFVVFGTAQASSPLEQRVRDLLAANDTTAAIRLLESTDLEGRPEPDMMITLGRLHRESGTIVGRLKSQKVLERAKSLFPRDPNVLLELGLTYFSQTFYPDACIQFRECVRYDPGNCEAKYKLGVSAYEHWKLRVNAWLQDAREACEWLGAAVACDSTNVDAARRLTNALYGTGQTERARAAAATFARRFPDDWHFPMMVGAVDFEAGTMERADSAFAVGVALMDESQYGAFTRIGRGTLSHPDYDIYEALRGTEQQAMNRGFWVNADPDPTTVLNERALEHAYRTFRADVLFSASKPHVAWTRPQTPGWDTERGETLIKFGWPDTIIASQSYKRWEKWVYGAEREKPAQFLFYDAYLNGKYQIPQKSANFSFIRFGDRVTHHRPAWVELDGAMDVAVFRDDNFTASAYTFIDVNADSIQLPAPDSAGRDSEGFATRVRMFREDWVPEMSEERIIRPSDLVWMHASTGKFCGYTQRIHVPFDDYRVAAAFEDGGKRVHALFRSRADARRFAERGVQLSDIVLERESGPTVPRGEHVLRPNPWSAYDAGQRLRTYVEIYNLEMRAGSTRYVLRYTIQERPVESPTVWNRLGRSLLAVAGLDERPPIVTQSVERVGTSYSDAAALAIDVDALPKGRYRLTVAVDDRIGGGTARVSEHFYKVGESIARDD